MQLGWIDFSKTERSKILSVLDLLSQDATLDELGIAPIRDGFSNIFFPGTSTIQTRAKYFFLVPYALKELELSKETDPYKILRKLDEIERECGEKLLSANPSENGIIGKRSLQNNKWVKRSPADIYWAGLRRYKIFKEENLSLSEYVAASCIQKTQKSNTLKLGNRYDTNEDKETDDKYADDIFKISFWNMPLYNDSWKNRIQMSLTKEEGAFLEKQITESCPDTMISYILNENMTEILDCESFSDLENLIDRFPQHIQDEYYLAMDFSEFIYVARTLYNIIISDGENEEANNEFEKQKESFLRTANIDIDAIFSMLHIYKPDLKSFVKKLQDCMLNNDIEEMRRAIISREIMLKGESRSKTAHPGEFVEWMGGRRLDYRFNNAKAILSDIFRSKEENYAESK